MTQAHRSSGQFSAKRRRFGTLIGVALLGSGLPMLIAGQAAPASGGMCVSATSRQAVEACPAGAEGVGGPRGQGRAPAAHLVETKRRQAETKQRTFAPQLQREDPRAASREVRELDYLRREVEVAERIAGRVRQGDPRGAEVLLRLAETYFELQQYFRSRAGSMDEPIYQAEQAHNAQRLGELRRQQQESNAQLERYRQDALRTYARIVNDYPTYSRLDEIYFSLAFGLEEGHDFENARRVYYRLIKEHPESRFVPHAWLSFAEYYFGEGQMDEARRFYEKVTDFPPDRNPVHGFALYKLAWVLYNLEDFRGALNQFARVIEYAQQNPNAHDGANLARQARRELVMPYARVGRPEQALEFFRRYASNNEQAFEMLESLAELYTDTGQWPETISIYHRLMAESPNSDKLCTWQSRVTSAVISSRPKDDQVVELRRLSEVEQQFRTGTHPAEVVTACRQSAATVLVEIATAWHREAVGTEQQPGTNDRRTMQMALRIYQILVERFPDMETMEFPDINRDDWPTAYRVAYFRAELAWKMEDWAVCGPAFDAVVEMNPAGEYTSDAAFAAVLCYNNLYQQQYQGRETQARGRTAPTTATAEDANTGRRGGRGRGRARGRRAAAAAEAPTNELAVRELNPTERGMLGAFTRFVCYVRDSEELPTVKYRRARIFYETNHFEEASVIFKDIYEHHPTHQLADYAAVLYLDALEQIRARDGRITCLDDLERDAEGIYRVFACAGAGAEAHADACQQANIVRGGVKRLRCETFARNQQHVEAAHCYADVYRLNPAADDADQVLWNAAIHYESARLIMRAVRVREVLIQRHGESPLAKRALYLIGANYHALAIYSQAADYYERFARQYPGETGADCTDEDRHNNTCAIAHEALENAVFFRLGLGEEENARNDIQLYERSYRQRRPRETANVRFSMGAFYERQNNWQEVHNYYREFLRDYARSALPHQIIRANVQMGRAVWEIQESDRGRAEPFFRSAVQAWERGAQAAIERAVPEGERERLVVLARDAASEAYFYLAEYQYQAFQAVRFPRAPSTNSAAAVTRWSTEDLRPWLLRKQAALATASAAYDRIAPLQIPQWLIAAQSRIGTMYQTIVDDIRTSPVPDEITRDPELEGIYIDALESVLSGSGPGPDGRMNTADDLHCTEESTETACRGAPIRQAKDNFERCLSQATQIRWFNEYSAACETQLNRLDPQRFPMAAELRGTASFRENMPGAVRPATLRAAEDEEPAQAAASESH